MKPTRLVLPSVIIATALGLSSVHAATFVWDGGGADSNWNTADNWNPSGSPADATTSNLLFTGTAAQLTSTNTVDEMNLGTITFDSSAASYNIVTAASRETYLGSGNALVLNSNNTQTFTINGTFGVDGSDSTVTGAGTGLLTFSGGIVGNRSTSANRTLTFSNGPFDVLITSTIQNVASSGNKTLALTKSNIGTLTLRGTNTYSGGTSVNGGKLVLDYNTLNTGSRLSDTAAVGVNGGEIQLLGNTSAASAETVGAMNVNAQGGKLTLIPGSGQSATFTAASLNRTATSSSILFRGTNLGASIGTFSQAKFTTAPTLVGGGTTGAQISILAYGLGDTSATGGGAGLVTYGTTNGIRLLDETTEYAAYASANTNDNAKFTATGNVTATTSGTATPSSINSLLLRNTSGSAMTVTIDDGVNLAPVSGTFLFRGDSAADTITLTKDTANLGTGTISLATNTSANLFVTAGTTATINAPIQINTAGALVKDGVGTLVLNQNITTIGLTAETAAIIAVNGGTLKAGAENIVGVSNASTGNYVNTLSVASGATFDINGFNQAFAGRGKLGMTLGSIVTNTGANATVTPLGTSNVNTNTTQTLDGTFTDGTPIDGATSGVISLDVNATVSSSRLVTLALSHGGHTLNNVTVQLLSSDRVGATFTGLTPTDHNTIYGAVTIKSAASGSNTYAILGGNAVSNGATVSKVFGDAPIIFTNSNNSGGPNPMGLLNINISSASGLLDGTTSTWLNDVTVTGSSLTYASYNASQISLDRGDGLSTNFTHQLRGLTFSGASRKLKVTANNGTTLEFTGTTTLNHSAATTDTIDVTAGTLALNDIAQTGATGAKGLTKSGAGTLLIKGSASYTGATSVTAGKLLVNGSIGASAVTVSNAGTILATDTAASFGSTLAINAGAIFAVGDAANTSTATATVTGATTFNNGSIFSWDINATGTSYDKVISTGIAGEVAAGDATFRIVASDALVAANFWNTNQSWSDIFTTDGTALNAISNWTSVFGSTVSVVNSSFNAITPVAGAFSLSGNTLTWTAVPEPTSALAGLLITAGLLRRRRGEG